MSPAVAVDHTHQVPSASWVNERMLTSGSVDSVVSAPFSSRTTPTPAHGPNDSTQAFSSTAPSGKTSIRPVGRVGTERSGVDPGPEDRSKTASANEQSAAVAHRRTSANPCFPAAVSTPHSAGSGTGSTDADVHADVCPENEATDDGAVEIIVDDVCDALGR